MRRTANVELVRGLVLTGLFVAVGLFFTSWSSDAGDSTEPAAARGQVSVAFDFGDGKTREFKVIPLQEGLTVIGALRAVAERKDGIPFTHRGRGATAFVTVIDGVKNEGGRRGGKNWVYFVNAKKAALGAGVYRLKTDDRVLWQFTSSE